MGNKSALVQEAAWHEREDKPSAEPEIDPLYRQIFSSPDLNMFRFENFGACGQNMHQVLLLSFKF